MPLYEYRCKQCGKSHEAEHGFNDARPTKCPSCGGQLVRVFHPVGVVFKGSGFHKTDYSSSGVRKETAAPASASSDATKADGKPAGSSDKPAADSSALAKTEAKPATKSPPAGDSSATKSSGTKT